MKGLTLPKALAGLGAALIAMSVLAASSPQPVDQHSTTVPPSASSTATTQTPVSPSAPAATISSQPAATSSPTVVAAAPPVSLTVTSARTGLPILSTSEPRLDGATIGTYDPVVDFVDRYGVVHYQRIDPPVYPQAVVVQFSPGELAETGIAAGTTFIYGHACLHHECPFDMLHLATIGDVITVEDLNGNSRTYTITAVRPDFSKDGEPFQNTSDQLLLVTCAYEPGGESLDNLLVVADPTGN